jgi:hypothetical protein
MSVYVDEAKHPLGRMLMCHMIADSLAELLEMSVRIGVDTTHVQYPNTYKEHFDVCKRKRVLAVEAGAIEITSRELALKLLARRDKEVAGG